MDIESRGTIGEALDYVLKEQDFLETVSWILEADSEVKSPEDLALGYFLGSLMSYASDVVRRKKLLKRIEKEQKERLEKELGKEKARETLRRREENLEDVKPIKVSLTEKETNQIRDMLKLRILSYRKKIFRELHT